MYLLYTGTESLMLNDVSKRTFKKKIYWLIFRLLIKLIDPFIQGNICVSEHVMHNVARFGTKKPMEVRANPVKYSKKLPKVEHEGFNILYYLPDSVMEHDFLDWLYGYDIYKRVFYSFLLDDNVHFIPVNGSEDMNEIYPIIDFYLRPNNHDGAPRMIRECEIQDIPYYWSEKDPDVNIAIKLIKKHIK